MIFPQSIRQGDTRRCDENGLGRAGKWTSVSPWFQYDLARMHASYPHLSSLRSGRGLHSLPIQLNLISSVHCMTRLNS